jgi:hypothetical protein
MEVEGGLMSRLAWIIPLSLVLAPRLAAQPAPADPGIIDMHVHAEANDPRWQRR